MNNYREISELNDEGISLREIASNTTKHFQKVSEIIRLAEKKELACSLEDENIKVEIHIENQVCHSDASKRPKILKYCSSFNARGAKNKVISKCLSTRRNTCQ